MAQTSQMWQVTQQTAWPRPHGSLYVREGTIKNVYDRKGGKATAQRMPRWGGASLHFNRRSRSQRLKHGAQPLVRFYFCQTKRNKESMEISMSKSRRGRAVSLRGSLEMLNCRKPREYNIDWE